MANWQYLKLSLITSFGGRSRKPLASALSRISVTAAGLIGFSFVCLPAIRQLPLASGLPEIWWLSLIAVGVQMLTGVVMLVAASVNLGKSRISNLLLCLPVSNFGRWLVINMSFIVLACLVIGMLLPPALQIGSKISMPTWKLLLAILLGTISGYGLANYRTGLNFPLRIAASGGVVAGEYLIIKDLIRNFFVSDMSASYWTLLLLFLIPIFWVTLSYRRVANDNQLEQSRGSLIIPFGGNVMWFFAKFARHRRTTLSFMVTLGLCAAAVYLSSKPGISSHNALLTIVAVLVSALVTDVRGISRKITPPEAVALRGSGFFIWQQIGVSIFIAFLATIPIFITISSSPQILLPYFSTLLFSCGVGLVVSELLVSGLRDITGQLTAAAVSVGLILGLPKIIPAFINQNLTYLTLAALLGASCYVVERYRNNHIWRKNA